MKRAATAIIVGFFALFFLALLPAARADDTVFERPDTTPIVINNDHGGRIDEYVMALVILSQSERQIVIDGECLSACTLFIGIIKRENVCVTERAVLGFHAGGRCKHDGSQCIEPIEYSEEATKRLLRMYPREIRAWIVKQGGLDRDLTKFLYMRGEELNKFVRRC